MDVNSGSADIGSGWEGGTYVTTSDWDSFVSPCTLVDATHSRTVLSRRILCVQEEMPSHTIEAPPTGSVCEGCG
jgi:hypothetical protein